MSKKAILMQTLVVLIVSISTFAQSQEKQLLQYCKSTEIHKLMGAFGCKSLEVTSEQPEGLNLPELENKHPLFAKWTSPLVERVRRTNDYLLYYL